MMASEWGKKEAHELLILGLVFAERHDNQRALDLFAETLNHNPAMVAAHVAIGMTYERVGSYTEMLGAFAEAIRLDSLSARVAIIQKPKEVELIYRILNPPNLLPGNEAMATAMPSEFEEAGNLIRMGMNYIVEEQDEEAIEILERSLRVDPQSGYAVALLTLTYLLLAEGEATTTNIGERSVLWEIEPALATLLFMR